MQTFTHNGIKYRKTNRLAVEKALDKGEKFDGFIVGNKINNFHWFAGWHLAHVFEETAKEDFVTRWNAALFYLEPELGSGLAIWKKIG